MFQIEYKVTDKVWYAMKASYGKSMSAKYILDSMGIEAFVPLCRKKVVIKGRNKSILSPVVPNLIFVKAELSQLEKIKRKITFLHNMLTKNSENSNILVPIIVSTVEMERFMHIVNSSLEKVIYVDLATTHLERGTKVRITGGDFEGYEGVLMKVKGARERRVVLAVEGVIGVAMTTYDANLIEIIH